MLQKWVMSIQTPKIFAARFARRFLLFSTLFRENFCYLTLMSFDFLSFSTREGKFGWIFCRTSRWATVVSLWGGGWTFFREQGRHFSLCPWAAKLLATALGEGFIRHLSSYPIFSPTQQQLPLTSPRITSLQWSKIFSNGVLPPVSETKVGERESWKKSPSVALPFGACFLYNNHAQPILCPPPPCPALVCREKCWVAKLLPSVFGRSRGSQASARHRCVDFVRRVVCTA